MEIKGDPVKHEAWKAAKRALRAKEKKECEEAAIARERARLKRFREVKLRDTGEEIWDVSERDLFLAHIQKRYAAGASTTQIGQEVGRSPGNIYTLLKEAGTVFRSRSEATQKAMVNWHSFRKLVGTEKAVTGPQPNEVAKVYASGASLAATARVLGLSVEAVKVRLRRAGVNVRTSAEQWALQFNPDGTPRNPSIAQG